MIVIAGLEKMLRQVEEYPYNTLLLHRIFSLTALLPTPVMRAQTYLKLAKIYTSIIPLEAAKLAYEVYLSGEEPLTALELVYTCLSSLNRYNEAYLVLEYIDRLKLTVEEIKEEEIKKNHLTTADDSKVENIPAPPNTIKISDKNFDETSKDSNSDLLISQIKTSKHRELKSSRDHSQISAQFWKERFEELIKKGQAFSALLEIKVFVNTQQAIDKQCLDMVITQISDICKHCQISCKLDKEIAQYELAAYLNSYKPPIYERFRV